MSPSELLAMAGLFWPKSYLQAFRDEGIFYEAVTNRILDEVVAVLRPRWVRIQTDWTPRGGMRSTVTAEYQQRRARPARRQRPT